MEGSIKTGSHFIESLCTTTITLLSEAYERTQAADAASEASIHRLRVITKTLRAYHQLILPLVPVNSMRHAKLRAKKIAAQLSGQRDSDVLFKTHAKLLKQSRSKKVTKSLKKLEPLLKAVQASQTHSISWYRIRVPLKTELAFWKRLRDKHGAQADLCLLQGLTACYRKARKRFVLACQNKDCERYHDWRKWAKYQLYQFQFLSTQGSAKFRRRIQALTTLGKLLGKHHDLHVYRQHIHQVPAKEFSSDQLAICDVHIRHCEKDLEAQCRKIGSRWFEEKPSEFEEQLREKCRLQEPLELPT